MPSDIQNEHPILARAPVRWRPYLKIARLDRPVGIWFLLFPCWWSLTLAREGFLNFGASDWLNMLLFALGAVMMRAAGCIVNDLLDMRLDAQVARTKTRPLPSGEITRKQALMFLIALLCASFLILLCLTKTAILLGVLSLPLVAAYPLMKRITWWPQAFLGITFNWGALMGWAAATGRLEVSAFLLYAGGFFWTLAYDTIYAHQDKEDDARIGVKSTARLFGERSRAAVGIFLVLALACVLAAKLIAFPSFMTPLLLVPLGFQAWRQVSRWNMHDPQNCLEIFKSNQTFGWLVLLLLAF